MMMRNRLAAVAAALCMGVVPAFADVTSTSQFDGDELVLTLSNNFGNLNVTVAYADNPDEQQMLRTGFDMSEAASGSPVLLDPILHYTDICDRYVRSKTQTIRFEGTRLVIGGEMEASRVTKCQGERAWDLEVSFDLPPDYRAQLGMADPAAAAACKAILAKDLDGQSLIGSTLIAYPDSTHMQSYEDHFGFLDIPTWEQSGPKVYDRTDGRITMGEELKVLSVINWEKAWRVGGKLLEVERPDGTSTVVEAINLMQGDFRDCDMLTMIGERRTHSIYVKVKPEARAVASNGRWREGLERGYGTCLNLSFDGRMECTLLNEDGKFAADYNLLPSELEYLTAKPDI